MFDRSALEPIPHALWSAFVPQLDQLGGVPVRTRAGVGAHIDSPLARGWYWACAVAPDCLVTTLRVEVLQDFTMVERPQTDYLALCLITSCDAQSLRSLGEALLPVRDEVVCLLPTAAGSHSFDLRAGGIHGGANVCALPSFVERGCQALGLDPRERRALEEACARAQDLSDAHALRAALRALAPVDCERPGARALYAARAHEACALAAMQLLDAGGSAGRVRVDSLAAQVDAVLRQSLAQPPTLERLAAHLYLSRTQLCQRFRAQTGMTVGQRLAQLRMEEAQLLLAQGRMSVRDVAHAVGFAHQSSFNQAFKRACGVTPTAWQARRS